MPRRDATRREFLGIAALGAAGLALPALAEGQAKKPNVILFFTDDQGWRDTSVQMMAGRPDSKSAFIRTPALERLAREGMTFSDAYAPSPVCSPSRDSVLYGQTPTRLQHSILLGKANAAPDALTTPRAVKAADAAYVTAHFGKWACSPRTPESAGFDVSDGRTDNWHGDWRTVDGQKARLPEDDPKRVFSVTGSANAFMEKQTKAGRPFYMRLSHYAVHVGHFALKKTIEKYVKAGQNEHAALYAAMSENLDTGLGLLLDKIDALGIADNTYVIFTSDNGGGFGGNKPLRGGKATLWEGGIRVPTVVRGPGVKAGSRCSVPIAGWDFLPTCADLAGSPKSLTDGLDGGSLRPVFEKGNQGKIVRGTEPLVFHYPWFDNVPMSTLRLGDYKLVRDINTGATRLFNVAVDIGESKDLSAAMPAKSKELVKLLDDYLEAVDAEKIDPLRAGREKQLRVWIANDRKEIETLRAQLAKTASDAEKKRIQQTVADRLKRIEANQSAMARVEKGRRVTAW
ncbi:sulfatase-like hydrolase/transferase [bacterium]|nr:sulfatase-like hydrolase/transferase [bacterium]